MGAKKKADNKSNNKDSGDNDDKKGGKVKGAQSVVVRHILVS